MEPRDNVNFQPIDQGEKNPNPQQPTNINAQIDERLDTLRIHVNQLRGTREPRIEFLATTLDFISRPIVSVQGKLTSIS